MLARLFASIGNRGTLNLAAYRINDLYCKQFAAAIAGSREKT
jgi:hypothetical protein